MIVVNADSAASVTTESGTDLRVLLDTTEQGQGRMSLAMETLQPGQHTSPHWHAVLEEIYFVTKGTGCMALGDETREVRSGDAILIPTRLVHCLHNTGSGDLVLLCPVSPPWYPEDYHSAKENCDD